MPELDLTTQETQPDPTVPATKGAVVLSPPLKETIPETQEVTRGALARGLLWLLTFAIGGVLLFVGLGLLDGSAITQSIFPSLVALAGTALGFYFGSQNNQAGGAAPSGSPAAGPAAGGPADAGQGGVQPAAGPAKGIQVAVP